MKRTTTRASTPSLPPSTYAELVREFPPRHIHDDIELQNAIEVVDMLMALENPTQDQEDFAQTWAELIETHERTKHADWVAAGTPAEVIAQACEQNGISASDLGRMLGNRELGSKILRGERVPSKGNIRVLMNELGIPAELLL